MAVCKICKREMLTTKGCKIPELIYKGKKVQRIKVGAPMDFRNIQKGQRCPDCGAPKGYYHHWTCSGESCPICHNQLLLCDCEDIQIRYSE